MPTACAPRCDDAAGLLDWRGRARPLFPLPPGRGLTRGHRIAPSAHERDRRRGHRVLRRALRPPLVPPGHGGTPARGPGHPEPHPHGGRRGAPRPNPRPQRRGHRRQPHLAGRHHRPAGPQQAQGRRPRRAGVEAGRHVHRVRHAHQDRRHREAPRRPPVRRPPAGAGGHRHQPGPHGVPGRARRRVPQRGRRA